MGRIVGAFGTSHIVNDRAGVEDRADRVIAGMKEIGDRIRKLQPDVLFVISSDHMTNFNLKLQPPFIAAVSDEYTPLGDMGVPTTPFDGCREFAEGFVKIAAEAGYDIAKAEEYAPDHGVALPVYIASGAHKMSVVPFCVNISMDPAPAVKRCWGLGQVLRRFIESGRPDHERVVIMGTGGLSHWLCVPQMGFVNEEFDRWFLDRLCGGAEQALTDLTNGEILEKSGNGGMEILNWIMMAAASGECTGELIYYEAIPEWFTGMGGVAMKVA